MVLEKTTKILASWLHHSYLSIELQPPKELRVLVWYLRFIHVLFMFGLHEV